MITFTQKLSIYLDAAYPIIGVETHEEGRIIEGGVYPVELKNGRKLFVWDAATGLVDITDKEKPTSIYDSKKPGEPISDPVKLLSTIGGIESSALFVLKDLHVFINKNPLLVRIIRSMTRSFSQRKQTLFLVSPRLDLPFDLQKEVQMMEFALPTREELQSLVKTFVKDSIQKKKEYKNLEVSDSDIESIVEAATGMTSIEFMNALSSCAISQKMDGKLTLSGDFAKRIFDEKIINLKNGLLEYVPQVGGFETIGGLTPVKEWAKKRRLGYEEGARKLHLPYPKGALLVGIRGCLHGTTPIYDPVDHTTKTIQERWTTGKEFHVISINPNTRETVISKAMKPVKYNKSPMLRCTFDSGSQITVTPKHQFLTENGYVSAESLLGSFGVRLPSSLGISQLARGVDAHHYSHTVQDCQDRCCYDRVVSCDVRLLSEEAVCPTSVPSLNDVHEHNQPSHSGAGVYESLHSRSYQVDDRLSKQDSSLPSYQQPNEDLVFVRGNSLCLEMYQKSWQSVFDAVLERAACAILQGVELSKSWVQARVCLLQHARTKRGKPISVLLARLLKLKHSLHGGYWSSMKQQLALYWHRPGTDRRLVSSSVVSNVDMAYTNEYSTLLKIEQVEDDCYYDFHVPGFNNYWAQGVWHHNCGKSVLAMAIAQSFGFPLFKLDIGKLFGSKVGESEGNVRELIRLLESLGRAVILVDEIEKSLNTNAASGQGDSGTGSRVFGTLISWMALKKCPIFIVGTANNIDALPPELIRKGRFDEIWWVDLPSAEERVDIFNKLLQHKFKRELRIKDVDDPMITESKDFSGAEIESVIEDALYEMLEPGQKYTLGLLVEKVLSKTVPQARINPEYIDSMRKKAASGYRMANDHVETAKIPATRNITL